MSTRPEIQVRKFPSNRAADAAERKTTTVDPSAGIA